MSDDYSQEQEWLHQERRKTALKLLAENPNYVLVEVKKSKKCTLECFDRKNLLIPHSYPFYLVNQDIRDRVGGLDKAQALFCYVGRSSLIRSDMTVGELYNKYKDKDGFLPVEFSDVETYG